MAVSTAILFSQRTGERFSRKLLREPASELPSQAYLPATHRLPPCLPSSCSSFLLCRSLRTLPTRSHPASDSAVAPSSLLLFSSSREALPNQKQLRQAVNRRLISNTKLCSVPCILLPRLGPALSPLHPTPAHTPAIWVVAYPRKVIPYN